jgi:hypothetical protein
VSSVARQEIQVRSGQDDKFEEAANLGWVETDEQNTPLQQLTFRIIARYVGCAPR